MSEQHKKHRPKFRPKGKMSFNDKQIILDQFKKEVLEIDIRSLNLNEKTVKILLNGKKVKIQDLVVCTQKDMFKLQGFNNKMFVEIKEKLKSNGVWFRQEDHKFEGQKGNIKSLDSKEEKPAVWMKFSKGEKMGLTRRNKVVVPAIYDEVFGFKDGMICVANDEKYGYLNEANEVVIPLEYDIAFSFSEGYAVVAKEDHFGYIDKEGTIFIPLEYEAATAFQNGEAKVKQNGKWGTINLNKEILWM